MNILESGWEAVRACSFYDNDAANEQAMETALEVLNHDIDPYVK